MHTCTMLINMLAVQGIIMISALFVSQNLAGTALLLACEVLQHTHDSFIMVSFFGSHFVFV